MTPTRRAFIKSLGIAMASLVTGRCARPMPHESTPLDAGASPRMRLRNCWLFLGWLQQNYYKPTPAPVEHLTPRVNCRAALDDLVAAGELDATVAAYVYAGYSAALFHVHRTNSRASCYEMTGLGVMGMVSRKQLVQQAGLLVEMAESSDLDPDTAARAQATIGRQLAFLSFSDARAQALYDQRGSSALDDLEAPPEAAQAARFLVGLLLEE